MLKYMMNRIAITFAMALAFPGLASADGWQAGQVGDNGYASLNGTVELAGLKLHTKYSNAVAVGVPRYDERYVTLPEVYAAPTTGIEQERAAWAAAFASKGAGNLATTSVGRSEWYRKDNVGSGGENIALGEGQGRVNNLYGMMDKGLAANAKTVSPNRSYGEQVLLAGEGQGRVVGLFNMITLAAFDPGSTSMLEAGFGQ